MQARFYADADAERWDAFCAGSYGATFLHSRRFLSYHGARFVDRSVVVHSGSDWLGVLPAAVDVDDGAVVVSHPGSTYGGIVHEGRLRGGSMIDGLAAAGRLLRSVGTQRLRYKAVPHIYHRSPAQDDLYALFRLGARHYRCDLSTCIDLQARLPRSERRRRASKKAAREGVTVAAEPGALPALWQILEENLERKHGARPTHTLEEIRLLSERFSQHIGLRVALWNGAPVAGVVLFRGGPTVHAQYIASSERGQALGALDAVFEACIEEAATTNARFFDFGISTEAQGSVLNDGLYRFKSEFGGSGVVHEFLELDLREI